MGELEKVIKDLAERAQKEEVDKKIETLIRVLSALYDKAVAYTNVIMAAGYAGFFAMWANMKPYMSPTQMRVSALCMTFSLAVFVSWEVTKMILSSRILKRLLAVLNAPAQEFEQRLKEHQQWEKRFNVSFLRVWPVVLVLAIGPAVIATAVLVYTFIAGLFRA